MDSAPCSLNCTIRILRSGKVPRNYVSDLEAQVATLTQQVHEMEHHSVPAPMSSEITIQSSNSRQPQISPATQTSISDGSPIQLQNLVKSVRNVVVEPSRQPRFLGQSSGITLARMVMAAVRSDASTSPPFFEQRQPDPPSTTVAAEASLPPRHAANHLVEVYFQYRTPHLPIVQRSRVGGSSYKCIPSVQHY